MAESREQELAHDLIRLVDATWYALIGEGRAEASEKGMTITNEGYRRLWSAMHDARTHRSEYEDTSG